MSTLRPILFYLMLVIGILSLFTGLVLYAWPHGPQAGRIVFLGMTKGGWQDLHTYVSIMAIVFIILHLIENRKCVSYYIKETIGRG